MMDDPVVIIGAGMAGLAAARHLHRHGVPATVLEASDGVGGRVRTDLVDGFRLDRGFQLLNPAYPEARRVLDLEALDLRPFIAGALISLRSRRARIADPRREPTWAWASLCAPVGSLTAELRIAGYALARALRPVAALAEEDDTAMATALERAGADRRMLERVLRPFLSGVFLEPELTTSRRFGDLVLRSFVRGTPAIPARGMQEIPDQLARGLDVRLRSPVRSIVDGGVLTDAGRISARSVIVAVDPPGAGGLLPGLAVPAARSVTTFYHRATAAPGDLAGGRAVLVLDGTGTGPVINSVVLTHASAEYAPPGEVLVSSSVLGAHDAGIDGPVRGALGRMYGVDARDWDLVGCYAIPYALPAFPPGTPLRRSVRVRPGVYVAGDHRDTPSLQGALVSGRRAAAAVLADMGATVGETPGR